MTIQVTRMRDAALDTTRRHIVPLSGGKDSTALSVYLAQSYPELDFEFVFCDTGAELPETYEYLNRLQHILGREIVRISALDMLEVEAKPGRSAFDVVLYDHFNGFLPSPRSRWCTRMLKIHPYEKCPSSEHSGHLACFWNGGSGSSELKAMRLERGAASGGLRWSGS